MNGENLALCGSCGHPDHRDHWCQVMFGVVGSDDYRQCRCYQFANDWRKAIDWRTEPDT